MASTVWKGYISFGLISVPVRLFAAARENHVSFNQIHKDLRHAHQAADFLSTMRARGGEKRVWPRATRWIRTRTCWLATRSLSRWKRHRRK